MEDSKAIMIFCVTQSNLAFDAIQSVKIPRNLDFYFRNCTFFRHDLHNQFVWRDTLREILLFL